METITCSEKVISEQVLKRIGEKRTLINNILRRKANWILHILRINCLLYDAIEGQMTEVKGVGRRRTQLHDDLKKSMDLLMSIILKNNNRDSLLY